jgi:iron-sulfur cluster repair protein YtfE (RIC family)
MIPDTGENPACSLADLTRVLQQEHAHLIGQLLPRIEQVVMQVADEAGPTADDALNIRGKILGFHAELSRLFDREEKGVFPMLWRLESQTVLSPCHAGMVKSRVRFAAIEQEPLMPLLAQLKEAVRNCPAAACRGVLQLLDQFEETLSAHIKSERESLFPRAVELETRLAARLNSPSPADPP